MKNVKKALLGTTLAGALVVSTGIGTYSWFTSDAKTAGQIENGTLEINDNNESFTNSLFELTDFAPSQLQWTDDLIIENTGTLATYLKAQYNHSVDKASLGQYKVGYIAYKYKGELDEEVLVNSQTALEKLFNGTTNERSASSVVENGEVTYGILTAEEFSKAASTNKTISIADGGESGEKNSFWGLQPDEKIAITFGVKLGDKAGNEYQEVHYAANFNVNAKQVDRGSEYSNSEE